MDCSTCRVWATLPEKRAARVCAACQKASARSGRPASDDPFPDLRWRAAGGLLPRFIQP